MFLEAGEVALDGVADVCHSHSVGLALRNAAREIRALGDENAVFVLRDKHAKPDRHKGIIRGLSAGVKLLLSDEKENPSRNGCGSAYEALRRGFVQSAIFIHPRKFGRGLEPITAECHARNEARTH